MNANGKSYLIISMLSQLKNIAARKIVSDKYFILYFIWNMPIFLILNLIEIYLSWKIIMNNNTLMLYIIMNYNKSYNYII